MIFITRIHVKFDKKIKQPLIESDNLVADKTVYTKCSDEFHHLFRAKSHDFLDTLGTFNFKLRRMVSVWHQSTARAIRKHRTRLLSYRSRGTLMSYTDHSAQLKVVRAYYNRFSKCVWIVVFLQNKKKISNLKHSAFFFWHCKICIK